MLSLKQEVMQRSTTETVNKVVQLSADLRRLSAKYDTVWFQIATADRFSFEGSHTSCRQITEGLSYK